MAKAISSDCYKLIANLIPAAMEVKAEVEVNKFTGVVVLPPK